MNQRRVHPLARREDELLQAALAASKHHSTTSSSASASAALPAPTKYGTLHGTLDRGTTSADASLVARTVDRTSSDDRLSAVVLPHLTSARSPQLVLPTDPSTYSNPAPRVLVADTPVAAATTSISDPIVSVPTRATMATEGISSFSSAGLLAATGGLNATGVQAGEEVDIVGDSDGECSGSAPLAFFHSSFGPLPPLPIAASTSSSAILGDSSRSITKTGTTDPILATTGSSGPPPVVAKPQPRPRQSNLTVEIEERPRAKPRTAAAGSAAKKRPSVHREEHVADDTDYEGTPDKDDRQKKKKKAKRTIVQSSEDEQEDASSGVRAEATADAGAQALSRESSPDPISVPSASASGAGSSKRKGSTSGASRRRASAPAISEDEDGQAALDAAVAAQQERDEQADSDFDKSKKKRANSRKSSAKGKERKPAPKRRPTVKKDGSVAPEPAAAPEPIEAAAPSSSAAEIVVKPKRRASKKKSAQTELDSEQDEGPERAERQAMQVEEPAIAPTPPQDDQGVDGHEEVVAAKKTKKRKMAIADDSEEEDQPADAPAPAPAGKPKKAPAKSKKKAPVIESSPVVAKRGRRTAASKNPYCPSSEVEPEPEEHAGAASDATSAIKTGNELPVVDEDDDSDPVVPVTKPKAKGKVTGKANTHAAEPAVPKPASSRSTSATGASASPQLGRRRTASMQERVDMLMHVAEGSPDKSFVAPHTAKDKGKGKGKDDSDADDEDEGEEPADAKENNGALPSGPSRTVSASRASSSSTPLQQRGRGSSSTPGSLFKPRPGSLAAILAKHNMATRAPGLSARQKVPPLHTNLKPPPPAKKILKDDKPKKKKKGDESYSDEEKPWYERKDPEEWDDADHARWQRRMRRVDRGMPPDTPTKD